MSDPSLYDRETAVWRRAQDAERRLSRPIIEYAVRTWGVELLDRAFRMFAPRRDDAAVPLLAGPMFDRWLSFIWVAKLEEEVADDPPDWPTGSIGLSWLASAEAAVDDFDRSFIIEAAGSAYTALLVESVQPGWSFTALDLLVGERRRIVDPEIAGRVRIDDLLITAVVTLEGVSMCLGPAPFAMPSEWRGEIIRLRRDWIGEVWFSREELAELDLIADLCGEYLDALLKESLLDPGEDPLAPHHLQWTLSSPCEEVLTEIMPLSLWDDEEQVEIDNTPDGHPHAIVTWCVRGPSDDPDDWLCVGHLFLTNGRLAADVPTKARADRLIDEIETRLGRAAILTDCRVQQPVRVHQRACWLPVRVDSRDDGGR